ncbi:hypothetical protein HK14_01150 [Acetobacter cibinongensis]|uniref:Uncharacterized protein n=1 Tax=Acetobacter cibinongensis TaxID=146475 RepID=A0A1Z5YR52_9PROT|nr:hypothetical protein HK14_01150 [Acetobacter cibinongensis]
MQRFWLGRRNNARDDGCRANAFVAADELFPNGKVLAGFHRLLLLEFPTASTPQHLRRVHTTTTRLPIHKQSGAGLAPANYWELTNSWDLKLAAGRA